MRIKWKWIWAIWLVTVIILSLMPVNPSMQPRMLSGIKHLDKVVHFIMYLVLSFTMLKFLKEKKVRHSIWWVLLFCIILGVAIEFIQNTKMINRNFDIADIIANIIGTFVVAIIFRYIDRKSMTAC